MNTLNFYQQELGRLRAAIFPTRYMFEQVGQAKMFIDKYYASDIDLDNISSKAFFSKFHFIRLFKSIYDKTPHQYLTFVRIEKAKALLASGKSITATCSLVGFRSITSFTALFKKATGLTPAAYQEKQYGHLPCPVLPFKYVQ